MIICEPGDVAVVLFPFTDLAVAKPRPALVLSSLAANEGTGNTLFAMITSAARSRWPDDVPLAGASDAGLSAASIVRGKLFTLDNRLVSRKIGALTAGDRQSVRRMLRHLITL